MTNLVSGLYGKLDRLVEDLSDRAVESASAAGRESREEPQTKQEELLLKVRNHQANAATPGVDKLIDLGFIKEPEPNGELVLTAFGDYLLPAPEDELVGDAAIVEQQQVRAGA